MKLSSAVGAKQQACKQARPSGFRISAFMAAKLLHTVKQLLGYDRLLHIRNDLLLRYGVVDLLVTLKLTVVLLKFTAHPVYCLFSRMCFTASSAHRYGFAGIGLRVALPTLA